AVDLEATHLVEDLLGHAAGPALRVEGEGGVAGGLDVVPGVLLGGAEPVVDVHRGGRFQQRAVQVGGQMPAVAAGAGGLGRAGLGPGRVLIAPGDAHASAGLDGNDHVRVAIFARAQGHGEADGGGIGGGGATGGDVEAEAEGAGLLVVD